MLAPRPVEAFKNRGIALPAARREPWLHRLQGAAPHAVPPPHQALAPHGLAPLRLAQVGPGHPAGPRRGAGRPPACRLDPLAVMRQERGRVFLEAIGEHPRDTAWRHPLDALMDEALRHGERALPHVARQPPLALRSDGRPPPLGRAGEPLAGRVLAAVALVYSPQHRLQLVELPLTHVDLTQEGARKGLERLRRFHQPPKHGGGGHLADPRRSPHPEPLRPARQHVDAALA